MMAQTQRPWHKDEEFVQFLYMACGIPTVIAFAVGCLLSIFTEILGILMMSIGVGLSITCLSIAGLWSYAVFINLKERKNNG